MEDLVSEVSIDDNPAKRQIDWERIEYDYRIGFKTLREMAKEHGVTHGAINKRAKRDKWPRDLTEKVNARAKALVSKRALALVSAPSIHKGTFAESVIVEAAANEIAVIDQRQKERLSDLDEISKALKDRLIEAIGSESALAALRVEMAMSGADENISQKQTAAFEYVASLPGLMDIFKKFAEVEKIKSDLERKTYRMDETSTSGQGSSELAKIFGEVIDAAN